MMSTLFKIIEDSEALDAIFYDNNKDIRIKICYPKYNSIRKKDAIDDFWRQYERLSINSQIINK